MTIAALLVSCGAPEAAPLDEVASDPGSQVQAAIDHTFDSAAHRVRMVSEFNPPSSKASGYSTVAILDHIGLKRVRMDARSGSRQHVELVVDGVVYYKRDGDDLWFKSVLARLEEHDPSTRLLREISKRGEVRGADGAYTYTVHDSETYGLQVSGNLEVEENRIHRVTVRSTRWDITMTFEYTDVPPIEAPPPNEVSDESVAEQCESSTGPSGEMTPMVCTDSHGRVTRREHEPPREIQNPDE